MARVKPYLYGRTPPPSGQRVFGTPGGSLVSSAFDANAISAGTAGEVAVAGVLDAIAESTPGFYVFHSVKPQGWKGDIDHVILYGDRVVVIDAKNWAGGSVYHAKFNGAKVTKDGKSFPGGSISIPTYVSKFEELFPSYKVSGILCVSKDDVTVEGHPYTYTFVDLAGLEAAMEHLVRRGGKRDLRPGKLVPFTSMVTNPEFGATVSSEEQYRLDDERETESFNEFLALGEEEHAAIRERGIKAAAIRADRERAERERNPHRETLRGLIVTEENGSKSFDVRTLLLVVLGPVALLLSVVNAVTFFSGGSPSSWLTALALGAGSWLGWVMSPSSRRGPARLWGLALLVSAVCVVAPIVVLLLSLARAIVEAIIA